VIVAISTLGYLGLRSDRLDDWSGFAGRVLGMQKLDRGGKALAFRMDNRVQRLLVQPRDTLAFMGGRLPPDMTCLIVLSLPAASIAWNTSRSDQRS
jgi:hypothetical protein